jgi:hypothetical protein
MGYQIKWFDYPMEHSVSPIEIHDLGKFFRSLYAKNNPARSTAPLISFLFSYYKNIRPSFT